MWGGGGGGLVGIGTFAAVHLINTNLTVPSESWVFMYYGIRLQAISVLL